MMWLKQLFSRRRLYNDLSEEIQAHLEEKIEELVASGMSRKEAAHAARREFGNVPLVEERSREASQCCRSSCLHRAHASSPSCYAAGPPPYSLYPFPADSRPRRFVSGLQI